MVGPIAIGLGVAVTAFFVRRFSRSYIEHTASLTGVCRAAQDWSHGGGIEEA